MARRTRTGSLAAIWIAAGVGCGGGTVLEGGFQSGDGEPHLLGTECRGQECPLDEAEATFIGVDPEWTLGTALAIVGDLDGDGYDDIVIGGEAHSSDAEAGTAYLIYGGPEIGGEGPITGADARLSTGCWSCNLAVAVAGAGDVNGDGLDDFLLGAPGGSRFGSSAARQGLVYVVLGSRERLAGNVDVDAMPGRIKLLDGRPIGSAGSTVAAAGDVDGDGLGDISIGAPDRAEYGEAITGGVYLVYGERNLPSNASLDDVGVLFRGDADESEFGTVLADVGDLDGDGFDDFAMAAETSDGTGGLQSRVFVVYGSPDRLSGTFEAAEIPSAFPLAFRGGGLAGGGDLDGDGFDDLLIGEDEPSTGGVHVVYGRATRFGVEMDFARLGIAYRPQPEDGPSVGRHIAMLGDVDGDGLADFAAGESHRGSGAAYLVLGRARPDRDLTFAEAIAAFLLPLSVDSLSPVFFATLAGRGDVNGDDHADFLLSVLTTRSSSTDFGAVFLVLGAEP